MIYTDLTKKALNIAYRAHQGQLDKGGCPYIFHPFHLAEQMETEEEVCVALLHDVLEDSDTKIDDLISLGFSETIIEAVITLTKEKGCSYSDYIQRVNKNPLSKKIKCADIAHNLDLSRLNQMSDQDRERYSCYQRALEILLS